MMNQPIMRRRFLALAGCGGLALLGRNRINAFSEEELPLEPEVLLGGFTWIKQSCFRIQDEETILYFDPYGVTGSPRDAHIIFVTHSHDDHCNVSAVRAVMKEGTVLVTEPESATKLKSLGLETKTMKPGDKIEWNKLKIEAVPSYNITKTNHPKSKNYLGFVVTLSDGRRVYQAGDTDNIPEMANIETDIALLPIGGTYTMNAVEAAQAAKVIHPAIAVPMHYGAVVGSAQDAEKFKQELAGAVEVMIFKEGQSFPPVKTKVKNWNRQ
ncbi:MAG: MBL fold metallo-hydrolase [Candidatus Omnitrophota bacterium]